MTPSYTHPKIIYVDMEAAFSDEGFLRPLRFTFNRLYEINEVISSSVVTEEEYKAIFPSPPETHYHTVYKYEVRIGKAKTHIYFDRWSESGAGAMGRWFVVKKAP